jgi:hypothetical protein
MHTCKDLMWWEILKSFQLLTPSKRGPRQVSLRKSLYKQACYYSELKQLSLAFQNTASLRLQSSNRGFALPMQTEKQLQSTSAAYTHDVDASSTSHILMNKIMGDKIYNVNKCKPIKLARDKSKQKGSTAVSPWIRSSRYLSNDV